MPLVQMPQAWLDTQRGQVPHASDAKDHFLLEACLHISAVESRRQFAIPRSVLFNIRVQEKQPNAATNDAPLTIRLHGTLNRCVNPIQALVELRLPTV